MLLNKAFSLGVDLQQLQEQTLVINGSLQTSIQMATGLARLIFISLVSDTGPVQAIQLMQQLLVTGCVILSLFRLGGFCQLGQPLSRHRCKGHGLFLAIEDVEHVLGSLIDHHQGFGCLAEVEHVVSKPNIQQFFTAAL
ncbi:hypothetical protein D3C71_1402310 [compost metagenome]